MYTRQRTSLLFYMYVHLRGLKKVLQAWLGSKNFKKHAMLLKI